MSAINLYDAMRAAGVECEDRIEVDGEIHRFNIPGQRKGKRNGWYVFHQKGDDVFGAFGDWKSGFSSTLGAKTPEIRQALRAVDDRSAKKSLVAAEVARIEWDRGHPITMTHQHPYLCSKGVLPHGLRIGASRLLVPMYRGGELVGLQRISDDGQKRFTRRHEEARLVVRDPRRR
jgi:putative DNA primase/helicase